MINRSTTLTKGLLIRMSAEELNTLLPNNFEPEAREILGAKTSKARKLIEKEA